MRLTHRFLRFVHRDRPAEPPAREPTTLVPPAKPKLEPADDPRSDVEPAPAGGPVEGTRPPTGPVELVPARTGPTGPASDAEAVLPGEVEGKPRPRSKRKRHGRKR